MWEPWERWLRRYPEPHRREALTRARARLTARGSLELTPDGAVKYKMQVKTDEKALGSYLDGGLAFKPPRPRCITAPPDEVKAASGCFFESCTRLLKRRRAICLGLDYERLGQRLSGGLRWFSDPVAVCVDWSSFDATQSRVLLDVTDRVFYEAALGWAEAEHPDPDLVRHARVVALNFEQSVAACRWADGGRGRCVDYRLRGTVASGKNNTTEGNTRRNYLYLLYAGWLAELVEAVDPIVRPRVTRGLFSVFVCGDDGLVFLERQWAGRFLEAVDRISAPRGGEGGLGLIRGTSKVTEVEDLEFVSIRILRRADRSVRVLRDPYRFFSLEPFTLRNLRLGALRGYMLSCSLAGRSALNTRDWAGGLRVFEAYARAQARVARGLVASIEGEDAFRVVVRANRDCRPEDDRLLSALLLRLYGITREDVEEVVARLGRYTDLAQEPLRCLFYDKLCVSTD